MAKLEISKEDQKTLAKRLEERSYPLLFGAVATAGVLAMIPDIPLFWFDEGLLGATAMYFLRVIAGKAINGTPTKRKGDQKPVT